MHLKFNGFITLEELTDQLKAMFSIVEDQTGKVPFIRNLDVYIRMEDEEGTVFDILDNNEYYCINRPDRFMDKVLEGLQAKKKQVEIARETGISTKRISEIKKYLVRNNLL